VYVKLEKLKLKIKLNRFELKAKIYIKTLKAPYLKLTNIKGQATPA